MGNLVSNLSYQSEVSEKREDRVFGGKKRKSLNFHQKREGSGIFPEVNIVKNDLLIYPSTQEI